MKSGKTGAGSDAVQSHTASLAGDYRVFTDVVAQYGVIEACSDYELLSYCEVLASIRGHFGEKWESSASAVAMVLSPAICAFSAGCRWPLSRSLSSRP